MAQYEIRKNKSTDKSSLKQDLKSFKDSLLGLFKNINFVLVFLSNGKNSDTAR